MEKRILGKTGLQVSEVGFGGEWLERHTEEEGIRLIQYAHSRGINIIDCWMADPKSRDIIGKESRMCAVNGSSRDISVPPGRTDSMCVPGI
jgi:predicted aldo/keto reductase-like oxidoreductase